MDAQARDNMLRSALILGMFAIACTGLVAVIHDNTRERIAASQRQALIDNLQTIIRPGDYDNDIYADHIEVSAADLLGSRRPVAIYRARRDGRPIAAIINSHAPNGYGGSISMLVGIYLDGRVAGVRILEHRETPGLGDGIEAEKSPWINSFSNKSLLSPATGRWAVRKDGGDFDQFTGATVTPRAVVEAVRDTLIWFRDNQQAAFAPRKKE